MADIFTEVDEDLRRDRAERLWKKYGKYVMALAILVVAGTAGWTWWTDHQRRQAAAEGDRFFAAMAEMDLAQPAAVAGKFAEIGRDAKSGYRVVALLHEAGLKLRAKDIDGALALYRAVAADAGADPDLRDAAAILGALAAVDTLPQADIDALLARVSTEKSPWRFSALEIGAVAALKAGNAARARDSYTRIADDSAAPPSLRARAAEMLVALGRGGGS